VDKWNGVGRVGRFDDDDDDDDDDALLPAIYIVRSFCQFGSHRRGTASMAGHDDEMMRRQKKNFLYDSSLY